MKIVMLSGSPHKEGTTACLAEQFILGAEEAGHTVTRFDLAFEELHPCRACDYCVKNSGICVQKDAMEGIRDAILEADLVALVTPMYYFGICTQLKMVIDRFYAFNDALLAKKMKSVLISVCGDDEDWVDGALICHYQTLCRYLNWENKGILMARGFYHLEDIAHSEYLQKAKELGASLDKQEKPTDTSKSGSKVYNFLTSLL